MSTAVRARRDIASPTSYSPDVKDFQFSWIATDLPGVNRRCQGTYGGYSLDSLPPEVAAEESFFPFTALLDSPSQAEAEAVAGVGAVIKRDFGFDLPEFFVRLMSSQQAQEAIPSCTACWFSLGEEPVRLGNDRGVALRFYRDQQDCCFWYIYFPLSETSKHCILCTFAMLEDYDAKQASSLEEKEALYRQARDLSVVCSPDIVDFVKRYYIENEIWMRAGRNLSPEMQGYIDQSNIAISKRLKMFFLLLGIKDIPRLQSSKASIRMLSKEMLQSLYAFLPLN